MPRLRNRLTAFVVIASACGLAGCAATPVKPYAGTAPRLQTLYVIASGWHTEIGVPVNALSGPIASLEKGSPDTQYVVFGWGQRDYYMAANPGLGDLLEAGVPGPSVLLVIPLAESPTVYFTVEASVFAVPVSQDGLDRLSQFLWDSLQRGPQGLPHRLGDGPYPGSSFYASTETYSLTNTCNTWTAEALHVTGLPVSPSGIVFAHGVVDQVRGLAVPDR